MWAYKCHKSCGNLLPLLQHNCITASTAVGLKVDLLRAVKSSQPGLSGQHRAAFPVENTHKGTLTLVTDGTDFDFRFRQIGRQGAPHLFVVRVNRSLFSASPRLRSSLEVLPQAFIPPWEFTSFLPAC
ncbi:hypothetical protein Pelo_7831 [Pelomyxa schiedti]|nr:hypothetical protein Pelo_7831 [Pelomyxa schiedti]